MSDFSGSPRYSLPRTEPILIFRVAAMQDTFNPWLINIASPDLSYGLGMAR